MPKRLLPLLVACILFSTLSFSQDQCAPIGWATQNGGTTGGGTATPVTVTTLSALQTQASSSGAKVIYVSGTVGTGVGTRVNVAANKTIIGLPGAKLIGGFDLKKNNIIIRNMIIQGPGAVDVDGVDCITIDGTSTTNVWIDHCDIYDGQDGNLDISNGANYIAVTWCKFYYTSASSNHQFCNLIGNSDSKTSDRTKLKVTMMYNWWGTGCKERMPRLRFGQVHIVNNYFSCTGNNHCVRAGKEADLLVESNYFDGVRLPIDLYENNFTAVTSRNNTFVSTTGNTAGSGTAFTPPYTLTITPSTNVKALVIATGGATLSSPTSCGGAAPSTYTLTTTASPVAGGTVSGAGTYNTGATATLTATASNGYTFSSWSGDASGTSTSTTVTMNSNKSATANFAAEANLLTIAFSTASTTALLQPPYVSGVINDPTDPARTKGIVADVKYNNSNITTANYTLTGSSSNTSVVTNANIVITKADGQATVKITPTAVGYATITLTLTKGPNTKTIIINYAVSAAASVPVQTTWNTGISDGSAAIALDDDYYVVADDELNNLYVHSRKESGLPLKSYNYAGSLSLPDGTAEETDLEGAVRSTTVNGRVYWIGSMGNGKEPNFNSKPNRNRIFATNISGTGAATSFSFAGYYGTLREKILTWGDANGYSFTTSAAAGKDSKTIDGFNVEGMAFGPDNTTLYIGLRAPLVPTGNRTKAVIVPILNFETWFNNGSPSGNPTFGSPIELSLGTRGIRDIVRLSNGTYIIAAGSSNDTQNSALYKWTGNAADAPVALSSFTTTGLNIESVVGVNESGVLSLTKLQTISDNGSVVFYNDGAEAKDLTQNNFKKYRSDVLTGDLSAVTNYTLTTAVNPAAGGTVSGAGSYASGSVVTVTATPASGYTFVNWTGDASGTNSTTTVTMSAAKSVIANFQAIATNYTLTTVASPAAGGTVSGAGSYVSGTVVTITATPAVGYTFVNWSGDASGTNASTTVTMSANKSVTANFQVIAPTNYTLTTTASPAAGGTVSGAGSYASGTIATVTATPAAGYVFVNWSGDASGTSASATVTMNANKSATANFQLSGGGGTTTIRIEDNATTSTGLCLIEGAVSSNSGANNTKVINLTNTAGKAVVWRVNVPSAGTYTLNWRYANSSTSNTFSMKFILNGVVVNAALPFPKTSGSSIFLNTIVNVTLNAGNNDIRLESIASNATADIDWIEITGNNPVAGNCTAARPAPITLLAEDINQKVGVYPNPGKGRATIGFNLNEADRINVRIADVDGKVISAGTKLLQAGYNKQELNITGKAPGLYNVIVTGDKGNKYIFKLIIQ
ncbi:MAG: T9SS type A sorting domain-containing protein [Bacteroidota bacterium]